MHIVLGRVPHEDYFDSAVYAQVELLLEKDKKLHAYVCNHVKRHVLALVKRWEESGTDKSFQDWCRSLNRKS